jgi:hypothetical protein
MKILKLLSLVLTLVVLPALHAEDVDVEISPPEPLMNESFFLTFKVKTTGSTEPYISFSPVGATVQGKREQGVSISTTVINGKFTTTREQNYVYELVAERPGQVTIKNIKVEMGGKTSSVKELHVNVLAQAKRIPDVFVEAQASKTKVYLGEGLDVNYYLYLKTSLTSYDIKEFPKLNKFIKRFHHITTPPETVQFHGQVFKRFFLYSARLFAEKVGNAVLDPMSVSVQIVESDYNSPFGGFGMGSQRLKTKELSSQRIEVEVLPLPSENVPPGFTGMVGEHEFSLSVPKNKYLVNEPIEIKLEVKGKGALENMDAPVIYADNNLEQFDTKSEVTELGNQAAKKVFEYTLLARGPLNIKQRELPLAYFDPATGRYVEKKVTVPALEVSGVAAVNTGSGAQQAQAKAKEQSGTKSDDLLSRLFSSGSSEGTRPVEKNQLGLVGPNLKGESRWFDRWFDVLNGILVLLIIGFGTKWYFENKGQITTSDKGSEIKKEIAMLKRKGINYSELYKVVAALDKDNRMAGGGVSINRVIDESPLSNEAKTYFKFTLQVCEEKNFGINKQQVSKINFEGKFFRELLKYV